MNSWDWDSVWEKWGSFISFCWTKIQVNSYHFVPLIFLGAPKENGSPTVVIIDKLHHKNWFCKSFLEWQLGHSCITDSVVWVLKLSSDLDESCSCGISSWPAGHMRSGMDSAFHWKCNNTLLGSRILQEWWFFSNKCWQERLRVEKAVGNTGVNYAGALRDKPFLCAFFVHFLP